MRPWIPRRTTDNKNPVVELRDAIILAKSQDCAVTNGKDAVCKVHCALQQHTKSECSAEQQDVIYKLRSALL